MKIAKCVERKEWLPLPIWVVLGQILIKKGKDRKALANMGAQKMCD
eukprot:CAMPEP_0194069056 /NCGR_PEP_ID=MMETSP0009_2-20130614/87433_1 /TAXON_ID=210454 /ORGANISM="Grammatophora oceanica, Strain CCMP 410" /LENGTH=45 /DNA_ID= /DNA_START= /DNA_END= /DNA_ORIENTATION=